MTIVISNNMRKIDKLVNRLTSDSLIRNAKKLTLTYTNVIYVINIRILCLQNYRLTYQKIKIYHQLLTCDLKDFFKINEIILQLSLFSTYP